MRKPVRRSPVRRRRAAVRFDLDESPFEEREYDWEGAAIPPKEEQVKTE